MKFSLTIDDLTADQVAAVYGALNVGVGTAAPVAQPAPPAQPTEAPAPVAQPAQPTEAPAPVAQPNLTDLDTSGVPYDARIHSDPPAKTAKGAWRKKRNVDAGLFEQITAELKQMVANTAPTPPAQPTEAPAPVAQPAPPAQPPAQPPQMPPAQPAPVAQPTAAVPMPQPTEAPAPVAQPAQPPAQPAPAAAAPDPTTVDFAGFMAHLTANMGKAGADGLPLITAEYLTTLSGELSTAFNVQLAAITDIAARPDMVSYAGQCMARDGRW